MENLRIIAAVRSSEELNLAVNSTVEIIFMLAPNIASLKEVYALIFNLIPALL